jgi:hypothetical protein
MDGVMERKDIKALARLIKKERKVQLSVKHRELTHEIQELLPPATGPLIDL